MGVFPALWAMSASQIYFWSTLTCLKIHCGSTNKINDFETTLSPQFCCTTSYSLHTIQLYWSMVTWGLPSCGSVVKNLPAKAGDQGLIPELGRSHGEGNGNTFPHSCLGIPVDSGVWWLIQFKESQKSQAQLTYWVSNNNMVSWIYKWEI